MSALLYCTYISPADFSALESRLFRPDFPAARREQLKTRRAPQARAQSLAATLLLGQALCDWATGSYQNLPLSDNDPFQNTGVGFRELPLSALSHLPCAWETDAQGKPFPGGVQLAGGQVFVSVSHSGGMILAAVADCPVGVDGQCLSALPPDRWRRLDERIRHPAESPAPTAADFARRWAAKEAAVKLSGEGLSRPLSTLRVEGDWVRTDGGEPAVLRQAMVGDAAVAVALAVTADAPIPAG